MRYQSTTGLQGEDMTDLVARIAEVLGSRGIKLLRHSLGLYRQVEMTLVLLRQNLSQQVVGDLFGISQPSVSQIFRRTVPLLSEVLCFVGISLEEALRQGDLLLVDGTFIPTGNRPASGQGAANYSGKRRVQCLGVQVAAKTDGT